VSQYPAALREIFRAAAVDLLEGRTTAQDRVYPQRNLPIQSGKMPALLVYTFSERKEGISQAGTAPMFRTTLTLVVEAKVEEAGQEAAEQALDDLMGAVEHVMLTSAPWVQRFEQISGVQIEITLNPEGAGKSSAKNVFGAKLGFDLVYTEVFEPLITQPLTGVNLHVDAAGGPVDLTGTYTPPFNYPVPPAPRTEGPDGREEIAAQIDLTQ
jgi:hypothetical protein